MGQERWLDQHQRQPHSSRYRGSLSRHWQRLLMGSSHGKGGARVKTPPCKPNATAQSRRGKPWSAFACQPRAFFGFGSGSGCGCVLRTACASNADERHNPRLSRFSRNHLRAGVVWIIAGTIYTASDLCIAIGMVTIAVGWISFMVEFRNRAH
jgi:hypothetical protein